MPMVRSSERSFARWTCLAAVAGSLMLLAACSDSSSRRSWTPWFDAVGGSSANDVYAVGSETILHYDGRSWTFEHSRTRGFLNGVWAASRNNVYVVWSSGDGGRTGEVLHFDGRAWRTVASAPAALQSVWGSSGSDVYAVGRQGTILHYDGNTWSALSTGRGEWLDGIWGSSAQDVFVAGAQDSILHYDGARWTRQYTGALSLALWGSSSQDVFAVGGSSITHYDGVRWSPQASGTTNNLFGVWGSSPNDVFAVGVQGTILHYDGVRWSPQASGTTKHLYGIWGTSKYNVFAVGQEVILLYDGTGWRQPATVNQLNEVLQGPGSVLRLTAPSPPAAP